MFSQISYNVVIDRFKAFADGHYLIRRFSHGQIDKTDLEKDQEFPWMHVVPTSVVPSAGQRAYSFDIVFTDLPREKEVNAEYQRESLSDCIRLAEDLLAEIRNGLTLFGTEVELADTVTMQPFIEEYTHVLTGVTLSCTLVVPWNWSACDIPANYAPGGSGSGGSGGGGGNNLVLKVNGVNNVVQNILDLVEGTGINITDNGDGSVTFTNTGGGGGSVAWGSIVGTLASQVDLTTALNLKADISSLGAVAFSNDYNDLDNLPSIPSPGLTSVGLQVATAIDSIVFLGSPLTSNGTITLTSGGNATQYVDGNLKLQTFPAIPAAQVNSDWNAVSGVAEILNKPSGLPPTGAAGGDLTGTYPNPTVDGIHGIEMQSGTPTAGDTWVYGGSPAKWQHQMLHASQVDNDSAVTGTHVDDALNHLSTTKVESNAAITGATATKITYDSKGLVTAGTTLAASDIPSGVDATKIGSGTVSNTEFGYLDGVTSAIQTQINAKEPTITAGTSSQYYRGDKTFQTLNIASVSDSTTVGQNIVKLANPSAIRYLRINADNSVSALSLAQLKSDIGFKQLAFKSADQSSAALAFADVTDLSFAVTSGKTYKFKIFCQFDVTNTSTGTRWAVNGPAFTRLFYNVIWTSGTGLQANQAFQTYDATSATANSHFTATNCAIIEGIVTPSANGTLIARFACELTITSVTCKAGSYIEYEEI